MTVQNLPFTAFLLYLALLSSQTLGRPEYMARIPNGDSVPNWPAVGHMDPNAVGEARNQFGIDFHNEGKKWTKNLCMMDSDNDGRSNGMELGDPKCVWKVGRTPQQTIGITNPGLKDSPRDYQESSDEDMENGDESLEPSDSDDDATTKTTAPKIETEESGTGKGEMIEPWKIAHCVFMAVSFGLILPVSTLFPYFMRSARPNGKWRNDHINIMYFGMFLGTIGFFIAVFAMGVEDTLHGIVGVVVMVLGVLQSLMGYFRAKIPSWVKWKKIHSILGRGLVLLIAFQVFFGYLELNEHAPFISVIIGLVHFGLIMVIFVAVMRAFRNRQKDGEADLADEEPLPANFAPLDQIGHGKGLQLT